MEQDIRNVLKSIGVTNIDAIINFLITEELLEEAFENKGNLKEFLKNYGRWISRPKNIPGFKKTVWEFVFN